jgi:hypothetical protein
VRARFPKNQLLDLLLEPAKGTVHTVAVTFSSGGTEYELTAEVNITGKAD